MNKSININKLIISCFIINKGKTIEKQPKESFSPKTTTLNYTKYSFCIIGYKI